MKINNVQHHVHLQPIDKFPLKMEIIPASLVEKIVFLASTLILAISAPTTSLSSKMENASIPLLLVMLKSIMIEMSGDALAAQWVA